MPGESSLLADLFPTADYTSARYGNQFIATPLPPARLHKGQIDKGATSSLQLRLVREGSAGIIIQFQGPVHLHGFKLGSEGSLSVQMVQRWSSFSTKQIHLFLVPHQEGGALFWPQNRWWPLADRWIFWFMIMIYSLHNLTWGHSIFMECCCIYISDLW